jgi:small-conductance mechanosensitive channel
MEQLITRIPLPGIWQQIISIVGVILLIAIGAWLVRRLLFVMLDKITARTSTELDNMLIKATQGPVYVLAYVFGFSVLFNFLQSLYGESLGQRFFSVLDGVLYAIGVLVVAVIVVKVMGALFAWYAKTIAVRTDTSVDDELIPLLDRAIKIVMYTIAVLAILDRFAVDVKGLIAVLGVGSLAVALAAQDTLANIIGGFVIMIDRPFRVGDRVRLADNTLCRVYKIGIRSTKFLTFDNTLIIVPNHELMNSTIHNTTYPKPEVRVKVEVGVGYDSDIDQVRRVMMDEADKHPKVQKSPKPHFAFLNFGDSALDVSLRCRVAEVEDQFRTGCELREQIYNRFRKEGIEIPFPQRVVTMLKADGQDGKTEVTL